MKKINIAAILIRITLFFLVLTGLNISVFAILSFTNQSDLIINVAVEKAYNTAYVLRNEVYKVLERELVIKIIEEKLGQQYDELTEQLKNNEISVEDIRERNEEIRTVIDEQIVSKSDLPLTQEDIDYFVRNEAIDRITGNIRNIIKRQNLSVKRFKLFTLAGVEKLNNNNELARYQEALSSWGYALTEYYKDTIPINEVNQALVNNEIDIDKFNDRTLTAVQRYMEDGEEKDILLEYTRKRGDIYIFDLRKLTGDDDALQKITRIIHGVVKKIIDDYYTLSEDGKQYEITPEFNETQRNNIGLMIAVLTEFGLTRKGYSKEAKQISDSEISKAIEASTSANVGGKLFVNEQLIDFIYMDMYIVLGDLIIKARAELPNSGQQYNSLFRLVLIAGTVIIVAHMGFIAVAYVILVSPMRKANSTLEGQNAELDEANKIFLEEMEVAQKVQEAILPTKDIIPTERVDIGTTFDSLEAVSGDYLDVINIDSELVGILVVDVSGHGVPSALVTTMAKVSFNSHSFEFRTETNKIFDNVNKDLCKATGESDYYCTAVLCVINMRTFDVYYSTGGHPKFLVYREDPPTSLTKEDYEKFLIGVMEEGKDKQFVESKYEVINPNDKKKCKYLLKNDVSDEEKVRLRRIMDSILFIEEYATRGFMIGAAPFARYQMDTTNIKKNDRVIIFSDGVIEAEGPGGEMYEYERLKRIVIDNKDKSSQELSDLIHQDVIKFRGEEPQSDDISIIVFKATEEPEIETPDEDETKDDSGKDENQKLTKNEDKKELKAGEKGKGDKSKVKTTTVVKEDIDKTKKKDKDTTKKSKTKEKAGESSGDDLDKDKKDKDKAEKDKNKTVKKTAKVIPFIDPDKLEDVIEDEHIKEILKKYKHDNGSSKNKQEKNKNDLDPYNLNDIIEDVDLKPLSLYENNDKKS